MRHSYFLFFISTCCTHYNFSQSKTTALSLYYEINEIESAKNNLRLDSLCNQIKDQPGEIKITGYADFLSDAQYNMFLAQKRAAAVKAFLINKTKREKIKITECNGAGEINSRDSRSPLGEPNERRVDVLVTLPISTNTNRQAGDRKENKNPNPDFSKNIKALATGERMAVEGLLFIPGRHVALDSSMPVLEQLLKTLKEQSNLKIEIQGHICCFDGDTDGFDYDNLDHNLSENRAKAVYEYLVKNGIDAHRLTYKGYGHRDPKVFPETTPLDEQLNRRVEIKILEH